MSEEPTWEQMEELADEITKSDFPFGKVKKIAKLDPSISIVTPEAIKMLTKAAELYMAELGKAAYTRSVIEKRKTVLKKDIDYVIKTNGLFEQLDDLLDDWPEIAPKMRIKETNNQEKDSIEEEQEDGESPEDVEEENRPPLDTTTDEKTDS